MYIHTHVHEYVQHVKNITLGNIQDCLHTCTPGIEKANAHCFQFQMLKCFSNNLVALLLAYIVCLAVSLSVFKFWPRPSRIYKCSI